MQSAPVRDATSAAPRGHHGRSQPRRRAVREGGSGSAGQLRCADALHARAWPSRAIRARRGTGLRARDRTIRPSTTSALLLDGDDDTEAQPDADHAAMDQQLHGSLTLPQDLADLGELEVLAEFQGHRCPLLGREVIDRGPDPSSLGAVHDPVVNRARRIGDSDGAVEARGRFTAAVMIIDGVAADLIEPGTEWVA